MLFTIILVMPLTGMTTSSLAGVPETGAVADAKAGGQLHSSSVRSTHVHFPGSRECLLSNSDPPCGCQCSKHKKKLTLPVAAI